MALGRMSVGDPWSRHPNDYRPHVAPQAIALISQGIVARKGGDTSESEGHHVSITPQGRSVQAMYRDYRDGKLLVNRRYQRKLVWTLDEKRKLIDSILHDYPVPLVLLAELRTGEHQGKLEIIDGMQRLNAIFSFIEHGFDFGGRRFDLSQFSRARQSAADGAFNPVPGAELLSPEQCSNVLDYQLAITIYPAESELQITDVFGRINAQGRQLSPQEQRQAGVSNSVSTLVRQLASEIRGDVSTEILDLADMPEISVEHEQSPHGYGIRADETIWCKQGILNRKELRDSLDEQVILDFVASIALNGPIAASREKFDRLYERSSPDSMELESALVAYGIDRIRTEILATFSVIDNMISQVSTGPNFLRATMRPGGNNPVRGPFYALFMAIFDLVVRQQRSPDRVPLVFQALSGIGASLTSASHYETTDNRVRNINKVKGLIQDHFVERRPPVFSSGAGLTLQVENCLRRSQIETARYETKQGLLGLDQNRSWNSALLERLVETACGIANLRHEGDILVGVADSETDAARVREIDGVSATIVGRRFVVGIDREVAVLNITMEQYVRRVVDAFRNSSLSEPLKTQILGAIDVVEFRGMTMLRIAVPLQQQVSFVGSRCFTRDLSETKEAIGPAILAVQSRFAR